MCSGTQGLIVSASATACREGRPPVSRQLCTLRNPSLVLAGRIGLEPISFRLTGDCSTIELTSQMPPGPATWRMSRAAYTCLSGCEGRHPLTRTTNWHEKGEAVVRLPLFHVTILLLLDCPRSIQLKQFFYPDLHSIHRQHFLCGPLVKILRDFKPVCASAQFFSSAQR